MSEVRIRGLAMDVAGECGEFCAGEDFLAHDWETERETGYAVEKENARN